MAGNQIIERPDIRSMSLLIIPKKRRQARQVVLILVTAFLAGQKKLN